MGCWQKESEFGKTIGCFKAPLGSLGLKYAQDVFNEKLTKTFQILKRSHSAEKRKRRYLLGFLIIQLVSENQNNLRGDPLATSKIFGKNVSECRKKSETKPSELSSNEKSAKNYGTQRCHHLKAPAIAF